MKTIERVVLTLVAAIALGASASAQTAERRATFGGGGGGGDGKCTIEVYVDGAAEVEIRGDRGYLRTLSGHPAQWRRFECSGPMPANQANVRFSGVDGRGRQELVQDPRGGPGAAVVRIQDRDGGAEAYTFDLEWRAAGFGPGTADQAPRGSYDANSPNEAIRACEYAVRDRASREYSLRDINFRRLNAENNPGRNDRIVGSFDARRGNARDLFRYSCSVNLANGNVQRVDIYRGQSPATADYYPGANDAASACERAAELRIHRDGYRNVQFGWLDDAGSRNGRMAGTAVALRGDTGRAYDFDIRCSVDLASGNIRSVQATRR